MTLPRQVKLVEVGPRDGLQNETQQITTATKINFINQLSETGLKVIEAGSFVSAKWVPQLADSKSVFAGINKPQDVIFPVLVPNLKGLQAAIEAGVKSIAVFTTPSESFSKKNTNCSVKQSLQHIAEVIDLARQHNMQVRGYLSCVLGCPYQGEVAITDVTTMAKQLVDLGCNEISLGDTIGTGTPEKVRKLIRAVSEDVAIGNIAVHFHDTYGQALANIYAALLEGVSIIDASVAGLGGCPYAKGATGNVATEDVLYMLQGMGIKTGVDLEKLIKAGHFIVDKLGRQSNSKVSHALVG